MHTGLGDGREPVAGNHVGARAWSQGASMGLVEASAKLGTMMIDQAAVFSGKLEKAKFLCYPGTPDNLLGGEPKELFFYLNPNTIQVEKTMEFEEDPMKQWTSTIRYAQTRPIELSIGELWFDTYDTRKSVREEYIDALESLIDYDPTTHYPNVIVFVYGEFTNRTKHQITYTFFMQKLNVQYTMFLADGTPVRAKVSVCLKQVMPVDVQEQVAPKESPDHAKIYTIKRGDTLQSISTFAYGTPLEWRRIANTNRIDDPMTLRPGGKLCLPPILQ